MIDLLISDIAAYPKIFFLQGALLDASIPAEICGMQPPDDLVESKAILLPTIRDTAVLTAMIGDDVETVTAFQRTARPNLQGAVFHTGCRTSTFLSGNVFLVFDESDKLIYSFNDLDSWYAAVPRKEFAERYGLTQI